MLAVMGILVLLIGEYLGVLSYYFLGIWLLLWLGITAWGAFDLRLNYFVAALHHQKNHVNNQIALTFDDGPHPNTKKILDLLHKYQMKATFFCIGTQIEKYPEIAKRIVAEQHEIGNHTYSHSNKTGFLSARKMHKEIRNCNRAIARITGKKTHLYRPPFGVTNPTISKAVQRNSMQVIGWNIRSLDTVLKTPQAVLDRILPRINKGSVVLLHDNRTLTLETLEQLLRALQDKKLHSVTVSELFNLKPYNE